MFQEVNQSGYFISRRKNHPIDNDHLKESIQYDVEEKQIELKLWIRDIFTILRKEDELYYFKGINLKVVDIYGVIVGMKKNKYAIVYTVDDGTGEIDCWHDNQCKITAETFNLMRTSDSSLEESFNKNETSADSTIFMDNSEVMSSTLLNENYSEAEEWLKEQIGLQIEMPSLDIGSTVQLRGKITDFKGDRCIRIYNLRPVTNIDEETDRRLELIHLYQTVYSQMGIQP